MADPAATPSLTPTRYGTELPSCVTECGLFPPYAERAAFLPHAGVDKPPTRCTEPRRDPRLDPEACGRSMRSADKPGTRRGAGGPVRAKPRDGEACAIGRPYPVRAIDVARGYSQHPSSSMPVESRRNNHGFVECPVAGGAMAGIVVATVLLGSSGGYAQ